MRLNLCDKIMEGCESMAHSVDYYLSKGFERKYAEYYASGRRHIISVSANDDHSLDICFDNNERRKYDLSPLLASPSVFSPLKDLQIFKRVYLDDSCCISWDIDPNVDSGKVWGNKLDLCPDQCYVDSVPIWTGDGSKPLKKS